MKPKLIYLASPYSDPDTHVRESRVRIITEIGAILTKETGHAFIMPITTSSQLQAVMPELGGSFDKWRNIDLRFIDAVDEVWVVKMRGWHTSIGVTAEIDYASKLGKPIYYIDPYTVLWYAVEPTKANSNG